MLLAEVWRALLRSPNFPRASITRYTHANHELILIIKNWIIV